MIIHTHTSFRLLEKHPAPLSLFTMCIQVEKNSSEEGNIARIRKLYDSALREHGSKQPGKKERESERGEGEREREREMHIVCTKNARGQHVIIANTISSEKLCTKEQFFFTNFSLPHNCRFVVGLYQDRDIISRR